MSMSMKFSRWLKPSNGPQRWLSQMQNPSTPTVSQTSKAPQEMVRLTNMRKRMFVLAGLYKGIKDVPESVSVNTFSRNMDKFRVRACIVLTVLSAAGSLSAILLAKSTLIDVEEDRDKRD